MNKLAVFDFDSTLMDGETIEILKSDCKNRLHKSQNAQWKGSWTFLTA